MASRWMRGGKLRAVKEHLEQATTEVEHDRAQLVEVQQQLDAAMEAQHQRPNTEQISAASKKEEHLSEMVAALE